MISNSTTNLATMSSLIANYKETSEAFQANQKVEEEQNMSLILDIYGEMYGMFKQREMEKSTLTSLSESLKADIIQLNLQNPLELETNRLMKSIAELAGSKILEIEIYFEKLIYQKQRIIEMQRENLEKKDHDLPYKKILELISETYNKIVWEQLAKVNRGVFESSRLLTPSSVDFYTIMYQDELKEYIASGKNQMEALILTLKNNIKDQKS